MENGVQDVLLDLTMSSLKIFIHHKW